MYSSETLCAGMAVASVTDQAGESQGGFQALLDKCGVDHRLAGAYHPQANGLTECANQTLIKSLVKMTNEDPLNLTNKFLQYGWPYRATRQASTTRLSSCCMDMRWCFLHPQQRQKLWMQNMVKSLTCVQHNCLVLL